ncbi:GbsR/MarR family transcriptional regulator [Methylopila musalis]|uniref:HTH-type transcriptional regulator n=1 Tax=Methylopila musalis TaxID=1134781 RepID=A0ABW3ZCG8_9HYPH
MTEITDKSSKLPPAVEAFLLSWGDMGGQWGVNRSIGQIHALLYLSERPMTAEEIADDLAMARSNVSNSLKELLAWNLIRRVPVRQDRRDHYEAETDVWEIAARIAARRKEREIDPAIVALRRCSSEADADPEVSPEARRRLKAMLDFTVALDRWYGQMLSLPKGKRDLLLRLGAKVASFLPGDKSSAKTKD